MKLNFQGGVIPLLKPITMENNQEELQQEEIPNIEQFQVGRIPAEDQDLQTDPQNSAQDDEVELGFTDDEPQGDDPDDDQDQNEEGEGESGEDDADFENPDDDPA